MLQRTADRTTEWLTDWQTDRLRRVAIGRKQTDRLTAITVHRVPWPLSGGQTIDATICGWNKSKSFGGALVKFCYWTHPNPSELSWVQFISKTCSQLPGYLVPEFSRKSSGFIFKDRNGQEKFLHVSGMPYSWKWDLDAVSKHQQRNNQWRKFATQ